MIENIVSNEPLIRVGSFLGVFAAIAVWEILLPRRKQVVSRSVRWPSNIGVVVLNTVLLRMVLPTSVVGLALVASEHDWGLLNQVALPTWAAIVFALLALDFIIYVQHVLFHAVPVLWRLHRMHHADLEFDVTTGARFHPIEILLSMVLKFGVVAALGPPAIAVIVFEVVLNATAMFNHGNIKLATKLDRLLRWFVVTPDMHRIHHSIVTSETNSNFGFNLPWWDRLFRTYRALPAAGHEGMTIGIERFRTPQDLRLDRMLLQPLRGSAGNTAITQVDTNR